MYLGKNFGLCITPQIFGKTAAPSERGSRFSSLVLRVYTWNASEESDSSVVTSSSNEVLILTLRNNTKQKQP